MLQAGQALALGHLHAGTVLLRGEAGPLTVQQELEGTRAEVRGVCVRVCVRLWCMCVCVCMWWMGKGVSVCVLHARWPPTRSQRSQLGLRCEH